MKVRPASPGAREGHRKRDDPHRVAFLVATGSLPTIPDIPGLSSTPYLTSDLLTSLEDMELKEQPESLIILGGGYLALELGADVPRFGTDITILERGERVLSTYEPEIAQSVMAVFRDEGITLHTHASVSRVQGDTKQVIVTTSINGRQRELRAAKLLIAIGRKLKLRIFAWSFQAWKWMSVSLSRSTMNFHLCPTGLRSRRPDRAVYGQPRWPRQ